MNIGGISAGYSYWGDSYGGQQLPRTGGAGYGSEAADTTGAKAAGATPAVPALPGSGKTGAAGNASADGVSSISGETADAGKKIGRKSSPEECQTCKERKYQDGSDENVSFKAATHIAPEAAGAAVRAHEGEHVSNAFAKAAQRNGEVLSATVSIYTAICPECGRTYVAGGKTRTTIKYPNESNPYQQNRKAQDAIRLRGRNIDYAA